MNNMFVVTVKPSDTHQGRNYAHQPVAVLEGAATHCWNEANQADQVLRLWVHAQGFSPEAVALYKCERVMAHSWDQLIRASQPVGGE